jgi:hypothetical protein
MAVTAPAVRENGGQFRRVTNRLLAPTGDALSQARKEIQPKRQSHISFRSAALATKIPVAAGRRRPPRLVYRLSRSRLAQLGMTLPIMLLAAGGSSDPNSGTPDAVALSVGENIVSTSATV